MIRIMWLCNTPLPEIQKELRIKMSGEGWLQGISDQLRRCENIDFHYIFPQNKRNGVFKKRVDNISFWGFNHNLKDGYQLSEKSGEQIRQIITEIRPDIIHIFGTEFVHSLECIQCAPERSKIIVSVQGLVSELTKVYTKKISAWEQILEVGSSNSLWRAKYEFFRRGINEKAVLQGVSNVIGRTAWDKRCVLRINPNCRYFYCSETLREPFYEGNWNICQVERHSIYISQANYPIKGFHVFIKAFKEVLKSFPDSHAYVAGDKSFLEIENDYGKYINKLIRKYGVKNRIRFLGKLPGEKVKEKLLSVHLTVMPSLLENSPNSIGEAMLLGTPVVAARVGGIPSIVRNEKEALLYSDHSARRMAECIRRVFSDDELALHLSANGRKRAKKLYDKKANLEKLLKIYKAIGERTD